MKLKCIRKKANERPTLDEVIINKDRLWVMDKNRRYTIFSLGLDCDNDSIAYLEIGYNIILVAVKCNNILIADVECYEYYEDYERYEPCEYYKWYEIEENITIQETHLYGDIFVLKKVGNNYCELNAKEIDLIMELLNK